jgi:hypothetical protein
LAFKKKRTSFFFFFFFVARTVFRTFFLVKIGNFGGYRSIFERFLHHFCTILGHFGSFSVPFGYFSPNFEHFGSISSHFGSISSHFQPFSSIFAIFAFKFAIFASDLPLFASTFANFRQFSAFFRQFSVIFRQKMPFSGYFSAYFLRPRSIFSASRLRFLRFRTLSFTHPSKDFAAIGAPRKARSNPPIWVGKNDSVRTARSVRSFWYRLECVDVNI